jgi:predicted DNA-binding transcriptional regulator AlpA
MRGPGAQHPGRDSPGPPLACFLACVLMTTRKADIRMTSRPTAYVTREQGAAEIQVSPSTWDAMVDVGMLPKPYMLGPNQDLPRWRWIEVDNRIAGELRDADKEAEPFFRGLSHGKTKERGRDVS